MDHPDSKIQEYFRRIGKQQGFYGRPRPTQSPTDDVVEQRANPASKPDDAQARALVRAIAKLTR